MAKQLINLGTPNGRDGDTVRVAFGKINDNFSELYVGLDLLNIDSNVRPATSGEHDLGGVDRVWHALWLGPEGVHIGGKLLSVNGQGAITVDGAVIATPGGAGVQADWSATSGASRILNKPTLSAVATSNDYRQLDHKPTIPTQTSQLENDAGYTTFSGSWTDLTNKPTLFNGSYLSLTNRPTLFSGSYLDLVHRPTLFSGSYLDLTNKPTIPLDVNQLTDVDSLLGSGGGSNANTGDISFYDTTMTSTASLSVESGNSVFIKPLDGDYSWQFDTTGNLILPEGGTLGGTSSIVAVGLNQFTAGGFEGPQAFFKVSDTLYEGILGSTMTLISGIWRLRVGPATYYESTDLITWSPVAGGLPAPVGSLDTVLTTNLTVDSFTWGFDSRGGFITPGGTIADDGDGNLVLSSLSPTKSVKIWSAQSLSTWEFGIDGKLRLPEGGDIVNSNGNSVLGGGAGGAPTALVNGSYTLSLDTDGNLTFPFGELIRSGEPGTTGFSLRTDGTNATISASNFVGLETIVGGGGGQVHLIQDEETGKGSLSILFQNGPGTLWTFDEADRSLTFPDNLTIANGIIGKSSSNTITEELPGITTSETTEIESQIEIATTGIVIAKRIRLTVDDGVTTATDEAGSTLTVNDSAARLKHYIEPEGPNNGSYFQVSTSNAGAMLEGVNETLNGGSNYARVLATQNHVTIGTNVDGVIKYWLFDYQGGLTLPTPTSQVFTLTFDSTHYTPTIGKPSLDLTDEPWELEGQVVYEHDGTAALQLTNIWPTVSNPGYSSGDSFTFNSFVHGLSDYILSITLNDVVLPGGAGWTANVGASELPDYPSNILANGAIKLTAGDESFILGADGNLHFPDGSFQGTAFIGTGNIEFRNDSMNDINGILITNASQTVAGTASIGIPANTGGPVTINNVEKSTESNSLSVGIDFTAYITLPDDTIIRDWSQRNAEQIEVNLFVNFAVPAYNFLTDLALGRAVVVTYLDNAGDLQTFTSVVSQQFTSTGQGDPMSPRVRLSGRIDGTLPADVNTLALSISSVDFPVDISTTRNWTFGTDGILTIPGNIRSNSSVVFQAVEIASLAGVGDTYTSQVVAGGVVGKVNIYISNDDTSTSKTWSFDGSDGSVTFPDTSTYNNSTLTGAVDSDLELEVKHITTVSAEAISGSSLDLLVVDISEDDDITVVDTTWEINAGSELAPVWLPVVSTDIVPGDICSINVPGFEFIAGFTYTFRNPTPESKSWTIRSQTGGLVGPNGAIITNEIVPGPTPEDSTTELAIELSNPIGGEVRWVFDDFGGLTIPDSGRIYGGGLGGELYLKEPNTGGIYLGGGFSRLELIPSMSGVGASAKLESNRDIEIAAGKFPTYLYNPWFVAETEWAHVRDEDASIIAPATRPWAGLPSWEAYDILMTYMQDPPADPPPPGPQLSQAVLAAKTAYEPWAAEQTARYVNIDAGPKNWQFKGNGELRFPDLATYSGKGITIPVDQSLTVNLSNTIGPGVNSTFKINTESIKLPTGNGTIFSGAETAATRWDLDSTNKSLSFPDAGDGVNPRINYSTNNNIGMELKTYANGIRISAQEGFNEYNWHFGEDGTTSFPNAQIKSPTIPQAGSTLTIATNVDGTAYKAGDNEVFVAYDANIISTFNTGDTIIFVTGETRTITDIIDNVGYINIIYDSSILNLQVFPITLKTSNYATSYIAPANIVVDDNTWTFKTDGSIAFPDAQIKSPVTPQVGTIINNLPDYSFSTGTNQYAWTIGMDASVYELMNAADDLTGWVFTNDLGSAYTVIQDMSPGWNGGHVGGLTLMFGSAVPSGHTYTVRSPDYAAKIAPALNVNVDENIWTFGNAGQLTLPGNSQFSYNETTNTETISAPTTKQVTIATYAWGGTEGGSGNGISVLATEETRKIIPGWTIDFSNSNEVFVVTSTNELANGDEVWLGINFQQDVSNLNTPIVATGPAGTLELTAGTSTWIFDGSDGKTTLPGAVVNSTVAKTGGSLGTETAIDLTKTINKLADGLYTLADGTEGQIMYLVRQTGSVIGNISVNVAHARVDGTEYSDCVHYPFNGGGDSLTTMIFTEGHWQSTNTAWDI